MTKEKVTLNCTPTREENEFPLRKSYYVQRKSFVVSFSDESSGDIYLEHFLSRVDRRSNHFKCRLFRSRAQWHMRSRKK